MKGLTFSQFQALYQDCVNSIYRYWTPTMQELISRHNIGWRSDVYDFREYLDRSAIRYFNAYSAISSHHAQPVKSVCDVGGFWGVLPVTLAKCGFEVTMTESLAYFGGAFDPLFSFIEEEGVAIRDFDPFDSQSVTLGRFDAVCLMAIIEHYPHSLKTFMTNIRGLVNPEGMLFVEVPNIAYWPRRIQLLKGVSPLTPITQVFESEIPFTGNHHEFTQQELRDLAELSGFRVLRDDAFTYSQTPLTRSRFLHLARDRKIREAISLLIQEIAFKLNPRTRELLWASWVVER